MEPYKYFLNLMDMQQNIAQHEEVIAELKQKQESRVDVRRRGAARRTGSAA